MHFVKNSSFLLSFCVVLLAALNSVVLSAQNIGINATGVSPNTTAMLDVDATNKGLLVPRVALTAINSPINAPATSLLVYNTSTSGTYALPGYYYFNGTDWVRLSTSVGGDYWSLYGNAATIPGVSAGQNYIGTSDNKDLLIATNATTRLQLKAGGSTRMIGDFENQELNGTSVSWNASGIADPASTSVTSSAPSAASLWLTTTGLPAPSANNTYAQSVPATSASAEVIDGSEQSITISDGSGVTNSGVLIMANVSVKVIQTATVGAIYRYYIWLQRSTDPTFNANGTVIHKVEDGIPCVTNASGNPTAGATNTTLIYPDLALAPGTYYYRLVFQGMLASSNGQTPTIQDRSMVLLQIKR
jgi:hypothetical protein